MTLVQTKGMRGYLSLDQKQELIRHVTDAVLSFEGEGRRSVTRVTIEDVAPGPWGIGGKPDPEDGLSALAQKSAA